VVAGVRTIEKYFDVETVQAPVGFAYLSKCALWVNEVGDFTVFGQVDRKPMVAVFRSRIYGEINTPTG